MYRNKKLLAVVIISGVLGSILGSMITVSYVEYKLRKDSGKIIKEIIIKEKDTIIRELGQGMEKEMNRIIENKKTEITKEVRKLIEDTVKKQKNQLSRDIEKMIDNYIKNKIKDIFS